MLEELKKIVGEKNVDEKTRRCFPSDREQVIAVVKWAHAHAQKTRVVSTDNNWGYNTFIKNDFPGFTINLSKMNRILDFDEDAGVISLEPGVTQGQLKKFLDEKGKNLIAPATGAGPNCSIVGNVLERGYGVTANFDHFSSCMSLEAIWPNGEIYRSPLLHHGGKKVGKLYKWGVGPFFDGLFGQSDYGVCTSMTIALKHKPSGILGVMFQLNKSPAEAVPILRKTLQAIGGLMGPIKITNQHRILALLDMAPELRELESPLAKHPMAMQFFNQCRIPLWQGFFAIYTDKALVPAMKSLIKDLLTPHIEQFRLVEQGVYEHPQEALFMNMLTGTPNEKPLSIAYFRAPKPLEPNAPFSPEKDGAGILWFAPLVPANSESVKRYLEIAHEVIGKYGFEPAISFTSLSDRCFDSVLALLFNSHSEEDIARAKACYEELFKRCGSEGFVPYRIPHSFDHLVKDARAKTEAELIKVFGRGRL